MIDSRIEEVKAISKQQYDTLYYISKRLNTAAFEDALLNESLDLIIKTMNAERGLVVKYSPKKNNFSIVAARNVQQENIDNLSSFSLGVLHKVLEKRAPVLYHDVQGDPNISQYKSIQLHNIKSILGIPVKRGNELWGVILVDSQIKREEFNNDNLIFLDFFSNILSLSLDKVKTIEELQDENIILKNRLQASPPVPELIGESSSMQQLFNLIQKVAKTDATALLLGESGTGKELIAKAIHLLSDRNNKPYLAQFCGSIPDTLLESELFGYKKGAFTGANTDKKGLFEVASNGTFFLDEIADISLALQAKLLRVLQNKEIMRLGDINIIKVNVRVIAATNKDLKLLVKDGRFREDLFYRLNVFPIKIPPLRERRGDIPLLVNHLMKKFSRGNTSIHSAALKILEDYSWPGNVRQLENVLQRALILCDNNKVLPEHIIIEDDHDDTWFTGTLREFEKKLLLKRLKDFDQNRTLTAKSLGVSVRWVQLKLKQMEDALESR